MITILCDHPDCNQTTHDVPRRETSDPGLTNMNANGHELSFTLPQGWTMQPKGENISIACPTHSGEMATV